MAIFCGESHARNWDKLINAIIKVETNGDRKAKNGRCVGIIQITPIVVKECNMAQKKKHYTLNDRYSKKYSKEMFKILQEKYNPEGNIEKAVRIWNGGPNYSIKSTNRYTKKVLKVYYNFIKI
jgi:hypothetical protein